MSLRFRTAQLRSTGPRRSKKSDRPHRAWLTIERSAKFMSSRYKMHWVPARALAFDPDKMKIAFRLTKDGVRKEGVGEVMVARHKKKVAVEILHTEAISDREFRTTKYSLGAALLPRIKKAKTESGEELLWLEA